MAQYTHLKQASLARDFLHTNSTSHDFLFGAMAELIDNSRDAEAKNLYIYTEANASIRGDYSLNFLDDGKGMSAHEAIDAVALFGYSSKKDESLDKIGQYGNGLKSASMRIGKDLIFFTKKDGVKTIVMLSRSFIYSELNESDAIRVPIPSFLDNVHTDQPYYPDGESALNKEIHDLEIGAITKYSPFRNKTDLLRQFSKIKGPSGTLVICYNLQLLDSGETEFDCESDPTDIKIAYSRVDHSERKSQIEHNSFRSYVSILYTNPKMKIFIQNKKVQTKILHRTLFCPMRYKYQSNKFKARDEQNKRNADAALKLAENELRDKSSIYNEFKQKYNRKSQADNIELTAKKRDREDAQSAVQECRLKLDRINKSLNEPKSLDFIFGVNVHNRAADGLFLYNCHRLILMHEHTKQQSKGTLYRGIVGVVDVPRMVLQPMHNKQRFIDAREEQLLINQLAIHMQYYVQELAASKNLKLDLAFWKKYGYDDMNFNYLPSEENQPKRLRIQDTTTMVQCNRCLHWRVLPWNRRQLVGGYPPDDWQCQDSTEIDKNSCRFPEHLPEIELKKTPAPLAAPTATATATAASVSVENRGFSITSKNNNQIVGRAYLAARQTNEIQKRSRADTQSDYDSDSSTLDDRRADPDFGSRNENKRTKNGTAHLHNSATAKQRQASAGTAKAGATGNESSIFERNIIREDADPTLPPIKQEPSIEVPMAARLNGRGADSDATMDSLAVGASNISMANDHNNIIKRHYQDLLSMMYHSINERHDLASASDEALAKFDYIPLFNRHEAACGAREKRETRRKIRTRLEQVLKKQLGEQRANELLFEIFRKPGDHQ